MWKVFTFTLMIEQSVSKKFARCFLLKSNKVPIVFPSSSIVQLLKQDLKFLDTNLPISHTLEYIKCSVQPLPLQSLDEDKWNEAGFRLWFGFYSEWNILPNRTYIGHRSVTNRCCRLHSSPLPEPTSSFLRGHLGHSRGSRPIKGTNVGKYYLGEKGRGIFTRGELDDE